MVGEPSSIFLEIFNAFELPGPGEALARRGAQRIVKKHLIARRTLVKAAGQTTPDNQTSAKRKLLSDGGSG
jgi:hypothetical protein